MSKKSAHKTYPCFVAASTIAATVIPAVPLCANKTNALFLIVPASYPSAVASWFQPTRRFLVAAAAFVSDCLPTGTFVPTNVPSDPELSPGLTFTPPGVPPPRRSRRGGGGGGNHGAVARRRRGVFVVIHASALVGGHFSYGGSVREKCPGKSQPRNSRNDASFAGESRSDEARSASGETTGATRAACVIDGGVGSGV